jgi:hypothetical protein
MGFSRALTGDVGDPAALGATSAHRSEDHRAARYRAAARYCTVGGLNMRNTRGDRNGHWIEKFCLVPHDPDKGRHVRLTPAQRK